MQRRVNRRREQRQSSCQTSITPSTIGLFSVRSTVTSPAAKRGTVCCCGYSTFSISSSIATSHHFTDDRLGQGLILSVLGLQEGFVDNTNGHPVIRTMARPVGQNVAEMFVVIGWDNTIEIEDENSTEEANENPPSLFSL
eukprot:gene21517-25970_t